MLVWGVAATPKTVSSANSYLPEMFILLRIQSFPHLVSRVFEVRMQMLERLA